MKLGGRNIVSLFLIASNLNLILPSLMNVAADHSGNGTMTLLPVEITYVGVSHYHLHLFKIVVIRLVARSYYSMG